jgi:hypothetical protein
MSPVAWGAGALEAGTSFVVPVTGAAEGVQPLDSMIAMMTLQTRVSRFMFHLLAQAEGRRDPDVGRTEEGMISQAAQQGESPDL